MEAKFLFIKNPSSYILSKPQTNNTFWISKNLRDYGMFALGMKSIITKSISNKFRHTFELNSYFYHHSQHQVQISS
jgi:hypothetical protein